MLKPINDISGQLTANLPPARKCESCGTIIPIGDNALNVMCIIGIGSPGHPGVPPFQCPSTEHWACSVKCWSKVAHACIDEHMSPLLSSIHSKLRERNV